MPPLAFLALVVGFWALVFATALIMTRLSLRGVGERLPEEDGDQAVASSDGVSPAAHNAKAQESSAVSGGAH
jgi:hypothetical protein